MLLVVVDRKTAANVCSVLMLAFAISVSRAQVVDTVNGQIEECHGIARRGKPIDIGKWKRFNLRQRYVPNKKICIWH